MKNVVLSLRQTDNRPAIVLDDVVESRFDHVPIENYSISIKGMEVSNSQGKE